LAEKEMQWEHSFEFLGLFLKAMKHEPKERVFNVPAAVCVGGS
jgi:hypothetical protein